MHEKILVETSGTYVIYVYVTKRRAFIVHASVVLGERIAPLVSNPGRIMLTSSRLYFQPYNNVELVS